MLYPAELRDPAALIAVSCGFANRFGCAVSAMAWSSAPPSRRRLDDGGGGVDACPVARSAFLRQPAQAPFQAASAFSVSRTQ